MEEMGNEESEEELYEEDFEDGSETEEDFIEGIEEELSGIDMSGSSFEEADFGDEDFEEADSPGEILSRSGRNFFEPFLFFPAWHCPDDGKAGPGAGRADSGRRLRNPALRETLYCLYRICRRGNRYSGCPAGRERRLLV